MHRVHELMKWSAFLTMSMFYLTGSVPAGEMILNGGFESGMSAWEPWHGKGAGAVGVGYSTSNDTRPGSPGKRSLQIDTTTTFAMSNWIRQAVRGLKGGNRYRISIWYKIVSGAGPDSPIDSLIVRPMKNDTNQDRKDLPADLTNIGTWKYLADEFTAHPSTTADDFYRVLVNLYPSATGGSGARIRLDDFSLWEFTAPTPVAGKADAVMAQLMAKRSDHNGKRSEGVDVGVLDGMPYLRNDQVIYLWSPAENGGGLLRIRDLRSGKQLLKVTQEKATAWRLDLKRIGSQRLSYDNRGVPCTVEFGARQGEATLSFTWPREDVQVKVETRLKRDSSLARSRIQIKSRAEGPGLQKVTFPLLKGVLPFSAAAQADQILETSHVGDVKKSPLVSGQSVGFKYPQGAMQFTALMGAGQGLYCAEEDGQAQRKFFNWSPDAENKTLSFSIAHPVLNWGAKQLVHEYRSPGDSVIGPFQGDWFDAARLYRSWALTAPWCRKGPIYQRDDYPQWMVKLAYWSNNRLNNEAEIKLEHVHRDFFDLPETICHDYGWMSGAYDHHTNPDYFPPRLGSQGYARVVKELQARNIRVVPYVIGWLWNTNLESFRLEDAERQAGLLMESGIVPQTYAGSHDLSAAMCPATQLWRRKMLGVATELVGKYGVDGVYFDYFTNHTEDCFNENHGHPIAGGNYWSNGVHGLYEQVRRECRKLNPEFMLCGEDTAEWCIDVLDTMHTGGVASNTPVYLAVYHGYTQVFGGVQNCTTPQTIGRWWLMGTQNGENNVMPWLASGIFGEMGSYYRKLLRCHSQFARPYLGYGEMLRPPKIQDDLPVLPGTACGQYQPAFPVKAVEGSAWKAPDGTVGVFFLNYDNTQEHTFTWTQDLNEIAGIGRNQQLRVTRWRPTGEQVVGTWTGGRLTRTMKIKPWGMVALKLEVVP